MSNIAAVVKARAKSVTVPYSKGSHRILLPLDQRPGHAPGRRAHGALAESVSSLSLNCKNGSLHANPLHTELHPEGHPCLPPHDLIFRENRHWLLSASALNSSWLLLVLLALIAPQDTERGHACVYVIRYPNTMKGARCGLP